MNAEFDTQNFCQLLQTHRRQNLLKFRTARQTTSPVNMNHFTHSKFARLKMLDSTQVTTYIASYVNTDNTTSQKKCKENNDENIFHVRVYRGNQQICQPRKIAYAEDFSRFNSTHLRFAQNLQTRQEQIANEIHRIKYAEGSK